MDNKEFEKAKSCAFWYLNKRRYTKKEIVDKLVKHEYDKDLAQNVALYLEDLKYIDDKDYARRYIHDAVIIKKRGIVRIKNDLYTKGIDKNFVEEVFASMDLDCNDTLMELIDSKSKSIDFNDERQKNRLIAFLVRRGFEYNEIFDAIKNYRNKKGNID